MRLHAHPHEQALERYADASARALKPALEWYWGACERLGIR
jgi:hypothetical protein